MNRRRYLAGGASVLTLLTGCLGADDKTSTNGNGTDANDDDDDTGDSTGRSFDEWGPVTDRTETRPDDLRFGDRLVFSRFGDGQTVRTPADGSQYLLVHIGRSVTDAPDGELVPYPDPFAYAVEIDEQRYRPLSPPDDTNVIAEPVDGGYATGGGSGAAETISWDHLAFEVPDDATDADVRIRYDDGLDGEPLRWVADDRREDTES